MSLFKTKIIKYGAMKYIDEDLSLHCSREEYVKAPFDGELTQINGGYILNNGEFQLYITHISPTTQFAQVSAGDIIGIPMVGNAFGYDKAYISLRLYKNNNLENVLKYIQYKDKTEKNIIKEMVDKIKEEDNKPLKPSKRKTSSRKYQKKRTT